MMTAKMTSASERYFSALNNLDQAAYVDCFSGDAEIHDPMGEGLSQGLMG
jgi:hypothetical protein